MRVTCVQERKPLPQYLEALEHALRLGDDLCPMFGPEFVDRRPEQPESRRVQVGQEVELPTMNIDRKDRIHVRGELTVRGLVSAFGFVLATDEHLRFVPPGLDGDQSILPVEGLESAD